MNSSLYARLRSILLKSVIFALAASSLVFTAQTAKAMSNTSVGVNPVAITVDSQGNVYTANFGSGTISKVTVLGQSSTFADLNPQKPTALVIAPDGNLLVGTKTGLVYTISPTGQVSTFATVGKNPVAMLFDGAGNLYTANYIDSSISKVTASGQVSRFAVVGTWQSAMARDSAGNLYTTSFLDGIISKVTPAGVVTQFATVGASPTGLAIDSNNNLFVTNSGDNTISKVTTAGIDSVFATVGKSPAAIAIDSAGNLYTANKGDNTVSKVTNSGQVATFAVTDKGPTAMHLASNGSLYVANNLASTITMRDANASFATTPRSLQATSTSSTQTELTWQVPQSDGGSAITDYLVEATTNNGNTLVGTYRVGSTSSNFTFPGLCSNQSYQLRSYAINSYGLSAASNQLSITAPNGAPAAPLNLAPTIIRGTSVGLYWEAPGCTGGAPINDYRISYSSDNGDNWVNVTRAASTATTYTVTGLVLGRNYLFRISSVNSFGVGLAGIPLAVTTAESTASYTVGSSPAAMAFDSSGNVYVANTLDNSVSRITTSGAVSRFATVGDNPAALVFDSSGNLYVANSDEGTITKITSTGTATLFAPVGDRPSSLVFDTSGNLYSADALSGTISKITPAGEVSVFADLASNPSALVFDSVGNLYSANGRDNTVSKITPAGQITKWATLPIAASKMVSDSSGNLYVFNTLSPTIYKITLTGELSTFLSLNESVTDLIVDAKNNFYFANSTDGSISKLTPAGSLSTLAVYEDTIVRIATDSNGSLFTSFSEGKVARSTLGKIATAPRSLTASLVTANSLNLNWNAPESDGGSAVIHYRVERSDDSGATWSFVGKAVNPRLTVTGLEPQNTYRFRVAAINGLGLSSYSTEIAATTLAAALSSPRNPEISQATSSSLRLSWLAPSSSGGEAISNYLIEYSTDSGSSWQNYNKPASAQLFQVISNLLPAKSYSFRITALTPSSASAPSNVVSGATQAGVPTQPLIIHFSQITKTSFTVNWSAPLSNNGAAVTNYQIELSGNSGSSWMKLERPVSTATSMTVVGLTTGVTYQIRVFAINSAGFSEPSEIKSISTTQVSLPDAPSRVSFSNVRANSFSISWSAVASTSKVTNYIVELSDDGFTWKQIPKKVSTVTSLAIGKLLPGTNYKLRVAAVNPEGQGAFATGQVTTLATVPTTPTKPSITSLTSNSAEFSWQVPGNGGSEIIRYVVELSGGGSSWTELPKPKPTEASVAITDLKPATKYMVRLRAINGVGSSKASPTSSFTTLATTPGTPTNLTVKSATLTSTVLTWVAPSSGGLRITDYKVEYSLDQGQSWLSFAKNASSSATVTLRGLKSKTGYLFRVSAKNVVGFGGFSQNVNVTTP